MRSASAERTSQAAWHQVQHLRQEKKQKLYSSVKRKRRLTKTSSGGAFVFRKSARAYLIVTVTGFALRESTEQLMVISPRPRRETGNSTLT